MQDFKQLRVWQEARELNKEIYSLTKYFPDSEKFGMVSQLQRASSSVCANIAEGAGRQTQKGFTSFLYIALGSIKEIESFVIMAKDVGHITEKQFEGIIESVNSIGKMLTCLIKKLSI